MNDHRTYFIINLLVTYALKFEKFNLLPDYMAISCWMRGKQCRPYSEGTSKYLGQGPVVQSIVSLTSQGPVVQSIISLTSSLVIKMLTVLVSTVSNSQVFLLKKCK